MDGERRLEGEAGLQCPSAGGSDLLQGERGAAAAVPPPAAAVEARLGWLAHVRHDLRTPMNAIIGYSEMLLEELQSPDVETLAATLRDILALGKQMLASVNEVVAAPQDKRDVLRLSTSELRRRLGETLQGPAGSVAAMAKALMDEAEGRAHKELVPDLRKIRFAVGQLLALVEHVEDPAESDREAEELVVGGLDVERQETLGEIAPSTVREFGRILAVDDNAMNRDMLYRRLQKEGHTVTLAAAGPEALQLLNQQRFDLLLLDMMMPEMNGDEVLRHIKSDPGLRQTPVIMLSSLDEIGAVVRCIEMGAEDYLPKPFDPVILRARINACLEKNRLREREVEYLHQIELERDRSDALLHVILPDEIVEELKRTDKVQPRRCEDAALLFSDIVGFTPWCETRQPEEILSVLQALTDEFEVIAERHGLLKIKTIGDAFMAAAGLLHPVDNAALLCVKGGLEMVAAAARILDGGQVRIGIQCGPVVAGVVGHRTYLFDVWGDTVNTAARIESTGVPGFVSVTRDVWERVSRDCRGASRGTIELKGKGPMEVFRVDALAG